jgi:hypothetical protein
MGGININDGESNITVGSSLVGTPKDIVFTIENTGGYELNLIGNPIVNVTGSSLELKSDAPSVIPAGGSSTFTITFNPQSETLYTGGISIANSDLNENPYNFTINGSGGGAPEMHVYSGATEIYDITSVNYFLGYGIINQTNSLYFAIRNQGSGNLYLTGSPRVVVTGAAFSLNTDAPSIIAPGEIKGVTINFTPTTVGNYFGNILIYNTDNDENPYNFNIQAYGQTGSPDINVIYNSTSIPNGTVNVSIGTTPVNTTIYSTFTIQNTGDVALNLSGNPRVTITNLMSAFVINPDAPASIPAGSSATFTVAFTPPTPGSYQPNIYINSNDPDEGSYVFSIWGIGN